MAWSYSVTNIPKNLMIGVCVLLTMYISGGVYAFSKLRTLENSFRENGWRVMAIAPSNSYMDYGVFFDSMEPSGQKVDLVFVPSVFDSSLSMVTEFSPPCNPKEDYRYKKIPLPNVYRVDIDFFLGLRYSYPISFSKILDKYCL